MHNFYTNQYRAIRDALKKGSKSNKFICQRAIKNGYFDCLKCLYENGYEWFDDSCVDATEQGNVECLKYVHENGCKLDYQIIYKSLMSGQLDCLKYAYENRGLSY